MACRLIVALLGVSLTMCMANGSADPWGKDADLAVKISPCQARCAETKHCRTPVLGQFAELMISFHQDVISPCDGPRSHFLPSSSQYALEALRKHGFFMGVMMGCDRLMRENDDPWVYPKGLNGGGQLMKLDPVR